MASNALMSGLQRASQGQRALDFIKGQLVTGCYAPGDTLPCDGDRSFAPDRLGSDALACQSWSRIDCSASGMPGRCAHR